jgi:hypothetical protein
MLVRIILACSAIVLLATPGIARDCPVKDIAHEPREAAIRNAPTCDEAMELLVACSFGGTGDVSLGLIVTAKCEAMFLKRLNAKQRRRYDRGIAACYAEHKNEQGTMFRSMAAICRAALAQSFAHRYGKPR